MFITNEKNTKATNNFNFRSKFKNLLAGIDQSNISYISNAFERFCRQESDSAISILWSLTYSQNSAAIAFNVLRLDFECIPAIKLRDELRHQYNTIHPGFLTVEKKSQEIQDAYEALKNKTDLIVSYVVYRHCCSNIFLAEYEINRIIYLLNSEDEKNFFGGIRSLRFSSEESMFLKSFHKEISNLFKALYDNQKSSKNLPFKDVQQLVTTEDFMEDQVEDSVENQDKTSAENQVEISVETPELPVESSHEETNQDNVTPISTSFKPLTAEEILANADVFTSFAKGNNFDSLTSLIAAGFDLNQVMSKKEVISNFIDAVAALD